MDPISILLLIVLGLCTGFLAGLLGIGGGMILVPFVSMLLMHEGFPIEYVIKVAIATSLTTILFTSLSSVRAHHVRGGVLWRVTLTLAPGIVLGSLAAAQIVDRAPGAWIAVFFGAFLAWSATQMLRSRGVRTAADGAGLPGRLGMFAVGATIGGLSALVGAGGGFLTVPFLTTRGVTPQQAVGTSAACGFPIAVAGTIGYVIAGRDLDLPAGSIGYIYLPALITISAASVLAAPLGARFAHSLPTHTLRRMFAFLLFGLAAYMLYKGIVLL